MRSSTSRRTVPTHRSTNAFACGARTGVRRIRMPSDSKTASKRSVNFASRSRMRKLNCPTRSASSMSGLRACWVTHAPVGLAVTPSRWTRRLATSTTKQHVQALEQHGVDAEEVARQHALGLRGQELPPGQTRAPRRWVHPGAFEQPPHGAGCDPVAKLREFAVDVESAWGAVAGSPWLRFPRPLAEPDVRLSPHPALHGIMPLVGGARWARGRDCK